MKKYLIPIFCILLLLSSCINFQIKELLNGDNKKGEIVEKDTPQNVLDKYLDLWRHGKYSHMYDLLSSTSKENISKQEFIDKYTNIFSNIGLTDMEADIQGNPEDLQENLEETKITLSISFYTNTVPTFEQSYSIPFVKEEDKWKVIWSPSLIFPNMRADHTVEVEETPKNRGQILDRYGDVLAESSNVYTVGAVPGKIPDRDAFIKSLAPIIHMPEEYIQRQLEQKWVTAESFVPLRSYPLSLSQEFKDEVLAVKGVMLSSQHKSARQYTKGAQLAHVTGYVQNINEELLNKLADKGYTQEDIIGKQGIEAAMEDSLRQKNGHVISIKKANNENGDVIAQYDGEDGNNIVLTIDPRLQDICYRAMNGHKGSIVALNPTTGETLAMASLPSFDPNLFSFGISQKDWDDISGDESYPLVNRTVKGHIPGSTFKPFTAAAALEEGIITPDTVIKEANNKEWFPSSDWGDLPIRRVDHPTGDVNLRNALVWSDNIYFAWTGLKLGGEKLGKYSTKYGLGDSMPFDLAIDESQIKGESTSWSDRLVADTAYGQGEILIPPVQLAAMFTGFFNNGSILNPRLIREVRSPSGEVVEPFETKVWKAETMKEETINTILPYLIDVVEDETGTARHLKIPGLKIGAKTGTAQLGKDKEEELAWLVAFTVDVENPLLITICLEVPAGEGKDKFDIAKSIFKEHYGK